MSTGALVGIIVAVVVVVVVIIIVASVVHARRQKKIKASIIETNDETAKGSMLDKGKVGEIVITQDLASLKIDDKLVFQNIMVPLGKSYQELDNILLTRKGIFLIECKTWYGTIRGNEDDKTVEHIDARGRHHHIYKNPIKQILPHVWALRSYLKIGESQVRPILVFTSAQVFLESSRVTIIRLSQLKKTILRMYKQMSDPFTDTTFERIKESLTDLAKNPRITAEQHTKDIKEKYGD